MKTNGKQIRLAVFDWAGTTVDFGCQAPVAAFIAGFAAKGIEIDVETARGPMGLEKREHIEKVAALPAVADAWRKRYGRPVSEADIDAMYADFVPHLLATLPDHCDVLPGVVEAVAALRRDGVRIGSTTGYFSEAAAIVAAAAARAGYQPDGSVCASDVRAGRPFPWMIYRVMEMLDTCPPQAVVAVGDTEADLKAGRNAGAWSIGVALTGNEMGLTEAEVAALDPTDTMLRLERVREKLYRAGAHWVIDTMAELPGAVERINTMLEAGRKP